MHIFATDILPHTCMLEVLATYMQCRTFQAICSEALAVWYKQNKHKIWLTAQSRQRWLDEWGCFIWHDGLKMFLNVNVWFGLLLVLYDFSFISCWHFTTRDISMSAGWWCPWVTAGFSKALKLFKSNPSKFHTIPPSVISRFAYRLHSVHEVI